MRRPNTILITGASSGIGEALAIEYADSDVTLQLIGRNAERLKQVATTCRQNGANVLTETIDVRDQDGLADCLENWDNENPIDLGIANAGISGGPEVESENTEQAYRIFEINVTGVLNTIHPLLPKMRQRGAGQIALMSSIAAFRGFPSAPAYSASKAAVKSYGEALRGLLKPTGIDVSVICPGFVKSRITDANQFKMPLLMEADRAARIIRQRLARNRARIAFPWPMYLLVWSVSCLPPFLGDPIVERGPKKRPTPSE